MGVSGQAEGARSGQVRHAVDRPVAGRGDAEAAHQDGRVRQSVGQVAARATRLLDRLREGRGRVAVLRGHTERPRVELARAEEPIGGRRDDRPRRERAQVDGECGGKQTGRRRAVEGSSLQVVARNLPPFGPEQMPPSQCGQVEGCPIVRKTRDASVMLTLSRPWWCRPSLCVLREHVDHAGRGTR